MKKKERKVIEQKIKSNECTIDDQNKVSKSIIINSGIRFALSLILTIYSMIFYDKMSKLAIITADTVLNHIVFIHPDLLYFISLFLLLVITGLTFLTFIFLIKFLKVNKTKFILLYYKIYDLCSFILSIIVIINTIILFVITPVTVEGNSMNNTLSSGDKALIWHFCYTPDNNDIVIVDGKDYVFDDIFIVKRIVAKEGDTLKRVAVGTNKFHIYSNDKPLLKDVNINVWYNLTQNEKSGTFVIPENKYVVVGDNRLEGQSYDSRAFGLVEEKDILGKLVLRYYPFKDFGIPSENIKR